MKNSFYKILLFIGTCKMVMSCQVGYTPDDLDNDERIPVVQGIITNEPGPYWITLKWASSYKETYEMPIDNAIVRISDDKGYEEVLTGIGLGKYKTAPDGITGTIGNTYTLTIDLPDGSQYISKPGLLKPKPEIENIYASVGSKEVISRNFTGEIFVRKYPGLNVFVDITSEDDQPVYYRHTADYFVQNKYSGEVGGETTQPEPVYINCIDHDNMIDIPNVKAAFYNGTTYEVWQHELGFLPYYNYDISQTDNPNAQPYFLEWETASSYNASSLSNLSPPHFAGWVTKITVYSINKDVYNYYESMVNQLVATDHIFDPIPTQIMGNIKCANDSSKHAIGVFEVTSVKTYYTAFFWNGTSTNCNKKSLEEDYNWVSCDTCVANAFPEFWVKF